MISYNNIGLFPTTWLTKKYISNNLSTRARRIWLCSWDLEDGRNNKSEKIVLKEPCVSLNIGRIWEKCSLLKLIGPVLDKTHVPDFPDSSSFAQNLNQKTVTSYSNEFLSWNIWWWFGDQICNLANILEVKMVSDVTKYINKPKLCIIIINLLKIKEKK